MLELIVLGHIPGTNYYFTFWDLVLSISILTVSYLMAFKRKQTVLTIKKSIHYISARFKALWIKYRSNSSQSEQLQLEV